MILQTIQPLLSCARLFWRFVDRLHQNLSRTFPYLALSTAFPEFPQRHIAFLQFLPLISPTPQNIRQWYPKGCKIPSRADLLRILQVSESKCFTTSLRFRADATDLAAFSWRVSFKLAIRHASIPNCFTSSSFKINSHSISEGVNYVSWAHSKDGEYGTIFGQSCHPTGSSTTIYPWFFQFRSFSSSYCLNSGSSFLHRLWIASSTCTPMVMNLLGTIFINGFFSPREWLVFKQDLCHISSFVCIRNFFSVSRHYTRLCNSRALLVIALNFPSFCSAGSPISSASTFASFSFKTRRNFSPLRQSYYCTQTQRRHSSLILTI